MPVRVKIDDPHTGIHQDHEFEDFESATQLVRSAYPDFVVDDEGGVWANEDSKEQGVWKIGTIEKTTAETESTPAEALSTKAQSTEPGQSQKPKSTARAKKASKGGSKSRAKKG